MRSLLLAAAVVAASAGVAHAYPQYQLSHEQTCSSCHISPVGGGLLNDMGELTAEDESQWGGNPAFLHGAVELPDWLHVGGDVRVAGGEHDHGSGATPIAFPMQTELYAHVAKDAISAYITAGASIKGEGLMPWFREHWLMWRPEDEGLYVRAGRMMPVYGLRQPEHIFYTRRYGGTPLFSEAYALNIGYVKPGLEGHFTAFIHDPLVDSIEKGDGAAVYAEKRLNARTAVGVEARYATEDLQTRTYGGVTGKLWLEGPKLLLQGEVQGVRQNFKLAADTRFQLVGEVLATYFLRKGLFIDAGLGHYDEDTAVKNTARDSVDLNIHFFAISHLEAVLMNRYQMIGLGNGGDPSFYSLLQLHYRI